MSTIKNVQSTFNYLNISEQELKTISYEIIEESRKYYNEKTSYAEYISIVLTKYFKIKIEEIAADENKLIDLLCKYIDYNISTNNIEELKKITKLLLLLKIEMTPERFKKLLDKNKKINILLESIFNKYKSQIVSGQIDKIFSDSKTITLMELYCDINNIEIKEQEDKNVENSYSSYSSDGVKEYLNEIGRIPLLSFDEEKDLATKAQNGDKKAYDKLVNANLRLVVNVAKRYSEESSSVYYTTVAVKSDGSYYDLNNIMPK